MNLHLEILVEEPSLKESLLKLLPKILSQETTFTIHPYRGKEDLLKKLPSRLQGYKAWIPNNYKIIILIDEDRKDCLELKEKLEKIASESGFITKSKAKMGETYTVINRIVVEELEAWFFGDPVALHHAYPKLSQSLTKKARYRIPDQIAGGTWEALEQELQRVGYFMGGLPKIEVAKTVSQYMEPQRNTSASFQLFYQTLLELKR
jgi:hypothetical protein